MPMLRVIDTSPLAICAESADTARRMRSEMWWALSRLERPQTSRQEKTPKSLIHLGVPGLYETFWDVPKSSSGGAGGNRTPVRKPLPGRSTCLAG